MTRQKLWYSLGAAITLVAVVIGVLMFSDDDGTGASPKNTAAAPVADGLPTEEPDPEWEKEAASDPEFTPAPEITPGETPPVLEPSEKPKIDPQAEGLEPIDDSAEYDPKIPAPVRPGGDGCDHNYGKVPLCVPYDFPAPITTVAQKCDWLQAQGFKDVKVSGKDRQGLDQNKNGIACDE